MPVHTVLLLIFILKDPVNNINLRLRFRIVEQYSLVDNHNHIDVHNHNNDHNQYNDQNHIVDHNHIDDDMVFSSMKLTQFLEWGNIVG